MIRIVTQIPQRNAQRRRASPRQPEAQDHPISLPRPPSLIDPRLLLPDERRINMLQRHGSPDRQPRRSRANQSHNDRRAERHRSTVDRYSSPGSAPQLFHRTTSGTDERRNERARTRRTVEDIPRPRFEFDTTCSFLRPHPLPPYDLPLFPFFLHLSAPRRAEIAFGMWLGNGDPASVAQGLQPITRGGRWAIAIPCTSCSGQCQSGRVCFSRVTRV